MKQSYEILLDLKLPEKLDATVEKPVQQTTCTVKDLEKELLVLRLAFGKLKATAYQAVAPLAAVFTRGVSEIVWAATRMVRTFGQVISGLFGITGAAKITEKTVRKTGKTAERSLASFDQLNRLGKGPSGGADVVTTVKPVDNKISEEAQKIIWKIQGILAPLMNTDTFPIQLAFFKLKEQIGAFAEVLEAAMGRLWNEHLTPLLQWLVEQFLPVVLRLGESALNLLGEELNQVGAGFFQMLEKMKPVTDFLKEVFVDLIEQVRQLFNRMRISLETDGSALQTLFITVGNAVKKLWTAASPVVQQLYKVFTDAFQGIGNSVFKIMQSVVGTVTGAVDVITGLLTGDWEQIWKGMKTIGKNAVNGIIGVLNALITGLTAALNSVISLFNKMKVKVPDWVPGLGGKEFGFNLKTVKAPQIPYLAKGAVLPANQPFLAMVGDQKHGTNIEAPLSTIQEAVAAVMGDQVEAMMAGFNALLQENRQLRRTVECIEVGDTVIGQAAQRYSRRQAVVRGGAL